MLEPRRTSGMVEVQFLQHCRMSLKIFVSQSEEDHQSDNLEEVKQVPFRFHHIGNLATMSSIWMLRRQERDGF